MRPGGIYSYAFMQIWSAFAYSVNRGSVFPQFPAPPTPPVVDEDGDGQIQDEIPVDLNANGWLHDDYRWPLARGPLPKYADGAPRQQHHYLSAIMQHAAHPDGAPGTYDGDAVMATMRFWDTKRPGDGLTAPDLNWTWFPEIAKSGVAVLNLAGWFDPFVRSGFELHATLAGKVPARIVARPVYHQGVSPSFAQAVGVDSIDVFGEGILVEQLRWYDRWLKGIDNGIDRQPAVVLFVMNEGWREEPTWPLPGRVDRRLYLSAGRALASTAPSATGADEYRADLSAYSAWAPSLDAAGIAKVNQLVHRGPPGVSAFLRNRQFMFGVPEGPPLRTEHDRRTLTYTTAPLDENTRIIGHPLVHLWVSSTAEDGDFYFYLEDVGPDGRAVLVTEFQHRAGFASLRNNDEMIPNNPGIDVKPDLPWHGFRKSDYNEHVFAGGKVVEIVTALYPTAWMFRKGHAIRLSVAAADWPTFELHPKLSTANRPDASDNVIPTITVHRGVDRASYIELPQVRR